MSLSSGLLGSWGLIAQPLVVPQGLVGTGLLRGRHRLMMTSSGQAPVYMSVSFRCFFIGTLDASELPRFFSSARDVAKSPH